MISTARGPRRLAPASGGGFRVTGSFGTIIRSGPRSPPPPPEDASTPGTTKTASTAADALMGASQREVLGVTPPACSANRRGGRCVSPGRGGWQRPDGTPPPTPGWSASPPQAGSLGGEGSGPPGPRRPG